MPIQKYCPVCVGFFLKISYLFDIGHTVQRRLITRLRLFTLFEGKKIKKF